jgi:hypothetical protein
MSEFKTGMRVELVFTNDEYTKLRSGSQGTLVDIHEVESKSGDYIYDIDWDDGSSLSLLSYAGDKIKEVV